MAELRKAFERAKARRQTGKGTLLFIDEIHRFNRAQQDSFLPYMEDGTITLIGATTENPSFELNAAVLSRASVLTLNRHDAISLDKLLRRAETVEGRVLPLVPDARDALIAMADGDGRTCLNLAEEVLSLPPPRQPIDRAALTRLVQRRAPLYDKNKDGHYNLISALHKSVRGSDPDAALYWLARMLVAGEDPLFLLRRVVRMAVEDIGMADPQALTQAIAAKDAYDFLGSPEGELALAQAVVYVATAPKSNAVYVAYKARDARGKGDRLGGAAQDHSQCADRPDEGRGLRLGLRVRSRRARRLSRARTISPRAWRGRTYYDPPERGFEREIRKRLAYWSALRKKREEGG